MIIRRTIFPSNQSPIFQCIRQLHHRIPMRPIPPPTPFIPDASTFLTVIGRGLSQHAAKIPSWEALFSLTSPQLRELGVEPARSRRYLLHWLEKFRNGEYGIGGDFKEVTDGVAEVRVMEVAVPSEKASKYTMLATATKSPGTKRMVVNVPVGKDIPSVPLNEAEPAKGVKVTGTHTLCGPHLELIAGSQGMRGKITIKEGLWEERRGHKIDGGERRRAEVRAKRRSEQNKANR